MNSLEGLRGCMNPAKEQDKDEVSLLQGEGSKYTYIDTRASACS